VLLSRWKSTGPRTEQGKPNSAKANLKHGEYAKQGQTKRSEAQVCKAKEAKGCKYKETNDYNISARYL